MRFCNFYIWRNIFFNSPPHPPKFHPPHLWVSCLELGSYIIIGTVTLIPAPTKVNERVRHRKGTICRFGASELEAAGAERVRRSGSAGGSWLLQTPGETSARSPRLPSLPQVHPSPGGPPKCAAPGGRAAPLAGFGSAAYPPRTRLLSFLTSSFIWVFS